MSYFEGHIRDLGSVPRALLEPLDRLLENSRDTFLVENAHKPNKFGDFEKSTQHMFSSFAELEAHSLEITNRSGRNTAPRLSSYCSRYAHLCILMSNLLTMLAKLRGRGNPQAC
jgi:hypothetical protein